MMMKRIVLTLVAGIVMTFNANAASFVQGLEDIPVMNGLSQMPSDGVSFGNEEGRFVEVYMSSKQNNFKQVAKFYKDTLPQMGWIYQGKRENVLIFNREGEILELGQEKTSPLVVRITVKNKL